MRSKIQSRPGPSQTLTAGIRHWPTKPRRNGLRPPKGASRGRSSKERGKGGHGGTSNHPRGGGRDYSGREGRELLARRGKPRKKGLRTAAEEDEGLAHGGAATEPGEDHRLPRRRGRERCPSGVEERGQPKKNQAEFRFERLDSLQQTPRCSLARSDSERQLKHCGV